MAVPVRRFVPVLVALGLVVARDRRSHGDAPAAPPAPARIAERIFDAERGLAPGWMDFGWSPHKLVKGAPIEFDLADYGGWILVGPRHEATVGGVTLRYRGPPSMPEVPLVLRLDLSGAPALASVKLGPGHRRALGDGWTEVVVPLSTLDPAGAPFDRLVIMAAKRFGHDPILLDAVGFTEAVAAPAHPARDVAITLDCAAPARPISPLVYGVAFEPAAKRSDVWSLGTTARRWGGNPASTYNWRLGNAWNTSSDWYFQNVNYTGNPRFTSDDFLDEDLAHHVETALTVPMLGWIAKDTTSCAFPVKDFGPQQGLAPENGRCGNGKRPDGGNVAPGSPSRTSVAMTPADAGAWIAAIRAKDAVRGRSVRMYILDNEPQLWDSTHRDVHPDPVGYDEYLSRAVEYAAAIRKADAGGLIAGPAEWGWAGILYSGLDLKAGVFLRPDRRAHDDVPLLAWWLRQMRAAEKRLGVKLLDVVDVHFYPQSSVGIGLEGGTDPVTSARRIRSVRGLWDPSYKDESWIAEPIRLIPRVREWIGANAPGLGISIGEWNFGAEGHMSGGLATAEALGRFGAEGITSAFYWTAPPKDSPAAQAFRAFRDFDGRGGRFLDRSVPARASEPLVSAFASRDESGEHVVAVLLNLDPTSPAAARLELQGCGVVKERRVFGYAGGAGGFAEAPATGEPTLTLPPYSMTVVDARLDRRK